MLFHSLEFLIFLPTIFLLYWFVFNKNLHHQNLLILFSSYVFYGWWDYRFLSLIFLSTIIDYFIGLKLHKSIVLNKRKLLLLLSIFLNLGILGFFKYYNFFVESWVDMLSAMGYQMKSTWTLKIILPVGISFYTFQSMSYTIDIYRSKLTPTKDFISFASFVSFFPQLVAGPIERAVNLLPQFYNKRVFNYRKAVDGMRQILWGMFKKVVIADNCGIFANEIFNNYNDYNGSTLVLGVLIFSFQIYSDFSGYSDIAIGTARLFGFKLMQNFAFPYFSRNIVEFWKRWHISLTSWLTDYVFTPLAISLRDLEKKGIILSIFITFLLSGLWHGANWTFVFWGFLHVIYFLVTILFIGTKRFKKIVAVDRFTPSFQEAASMVLTFCLVSFSNIFFRAESIHHAIHYISKIFSNSFFSIPEIPSKTVIILIIIVVFFEWLGREGKYGIENLIISCKRSLRWIVYMILVILILYYAGAKQPFFYFQF